MLFQTGRRLFRFQFKDDSKAARNSATQVYTQYIEEPKTSQRSLRFEMGSELQGLAGRLTILMVGLFVVMTAVSAWAFEGEHRLQAGVPLAIGIGAEVSNGDYGSGANATVVTVPLLVAVNPLPELDLNFELPLVYLSSRSGSGFVVTQSGSGGRRRGGMSGTAMTITTPSVMTTATGSTITEAGLGDINMTVGYTVLQDGDRTPRIRPMVYLKAPTGDKDHGLGTGTFEGGPGLSLSKWLGDFQLFGDASYIFQSTTSSYQGRNYLSYSGGIGLQATDRLYLSAYAKGSSARVTGGAAPVEGRLKLNFLQSRRISWELYGLVGFTDASPAAGGGLLVMYQF